MALGTTALPFWPALLFTYIEPCALPTLPTSIIIKVSKLISTVLLFLGIHSAVTSPSRFVASQLPIVTPSDPVAPSAIILAYTVGNVYLILAGFGILCTVLTRDPNVTKYYLLVLMCGDVGHLIANYAGMGSGIFWNWREWTDAMWGNIPVTVILFANRLATVLGVFGTPGWSFTTKPKAS